MKMHSFFATTVLFAAALTAHAQQLYQPFEAIGNDHFPPVHGKASAGSTIEISTENAHFGQKSAKFSYRFGGSGYAAVHSARPRDAVVAGNRLYVSLWICGAGKNSFSGAALRLLDAQGEIFQYALPAAMTQALNGTDWREVRAEINLDKPAAHWGGKKNGARDLPLKFFGFAFYHGGREANGKANPSHGAIFIDDLRLSTQPIPN